MATVGNNNLCFFWYQENSKENIELDQGPQNFRMKNAFVFTFFPLGVEVIGIDEEFFLLPFPLAAPLTAGELGLGRGGISVKSSSFTEMNTHNHWGKISYPYIYLKYSNVSNVSKESLPIIGGGLGGLLTGNKWCPSRTELRGRRRSSEGVNCL